MEFLEVPGDASVPDLPRTQQTRYGHFQDGSALGRLRYVLQQLNVDQVMRAINALNDGLRDCPLDQKLRSDGCAKSQAVGVFVPSSDTLHVDGGVRFDETEYNVGDYTSSAIIAKSDCHNRKCYEAHSPSSSFYVRPSSASTSVPSSSIFPSSSSICFAVPSVDNVQFTTRVQNERAPLAHSSKVLNCTLASSTAKDHESSDVVPSCSGAVARSHVSSTCNVAGQNVGASSLHVQATNGQTRVEAVFCVTSDVNSFYRSERDKPMSQSKAATSQCLQDNIRSLAPHVDTSDDASNNQSACTPVSKKVRLRHSPGCCVASDAVPQDTTSLGSRRSLRLLRKLQWTGEQRSLESRKENTSKNCRRTAKKVTSADIKANVRIRRRALASTRKTTQSQTRNDACRRTSSGVVATSPYSRKRRKYNGNRMEEFNSRFPHTVSRDTANQHGPEHNRICASIREGELRTPKKSSRRSPTPLACKHPLKRLTGGCWVKAKTFTGRNAIHQEMRAGATPMQSPCALPSSVHTCSRVRHEDSVGAAQESMGTDLFGDECEDNWTFAQPRSRGIPKRENQGASINLRSGRSCPDETRDSEDVEAPAEHVCGAGSFTPTLQHKVLRQLPSHIPEFDLGLFLARAAALSSHADDIVPLLEDDEIMDGSTVLRYLDPSKSGIQMRAEKFVLESFIGDIPKKDGGYRPFLDMKEVSWCKRPSTEDGELGNENTGVGALRQHMITEQERWNPLSVFGTSPPSVELGDVFGYETYSNTAPSARISHPLFRRLSQFAAFSNVYNCLSRDEWQKVVSTFHRHWAKQCQLDLDWRNDPLTIEEIMWMLEANGQTEDKSSSVYEAEACFCVTPNPLAGFGWNDPRCHMYKVRRPSMGYHILEEAQQNEARNTEIKNASLCRTNVAADRCQCDSSIRICSTRRSSSHTIGRANLSILRKHKIVSPTLRLRPSNLLLSKQKSPVGAYTQTGCC